MANSVDLATIVGKSIYVRSSQEELLNIQITNDFQNVPIRSMKFKHFSQQRAAENISFYAIGFDNYWSKSWQFI